MGKRTQRIQGATLATAGGNLVGKEIHLILWTGGTYFGTVLGLDNQTLTLIGKGSVWYNRKANTHTFAFAQIQEVVLETVTEW